jgi:hypothetical protein
VWAALELLELLGTRVAWYMRLADSMCFPLNFWSRGRFIALSECEWAFVPSDVVSETKDKTRGPQGTFDVENLFKFYRGVQRRHKGKNISQSTICHVGKLSNILRDSEKPQVVAAPIDKSIGQTNRTIPETYFSFKKDKEYECSLGDKYADAMLDPEERKGVPTPNPQAYGIIPYAILAMLQCDSDIDDMATVRNAWMSLVFVPGAFVSRMWPDDLGAPIWWVVSTTQHGFVYWVCDIYPLGEYSHEVVPRMTGPHRTGFFCCTCLSNWYVLGVKTVGGGEVVNAHGLDAAYNSPSRTWFWELDNDCEVICGVNYPMTVLESGGLGGFKHLTVAYMRKCVQLVNSTLKGKAIPTTEKDVLDFLLRLVFIRATDADIVCCAAERGAKIAAKIQSALNADSLELAGMDEILDDGPEAANLENDVKECEKRWVADHERTNNRTRARQAGGGGTASTRHANSGSRSSSSSDHVVIPPQRDGVGDWTPGLPAPLPASVDASGTFFLYATYF